jgi:hypothetical protein
MDPMPYSPDCATGKHRACTGGAWDFTTDQPADCACGCHQEDQ